MEQWDDAHFREQVTNKATAARDLYKDGIRSINYDF